MPVRGVEAEETKALGASVFAYKEREIEKRGNYMQMYDATLGDNFGTNLLYASGICNYYYGFVSLFGMPVLSFLMLLRYGVLSN